MTIQKEEVVVRGRVHTSESSGSVYPNYYSQIDTSVALIDSPKTRFLGQACLAAPTRKHALHDLKFPIYMTEDATRDAEMSCLSSVWCALCSICVLLVVILGETGYSSGDWHKPCKPAVRPSWQLMRPPGAPRRLLRNCRTGGLGFRVWGFSSGHKRSGALPKNSEILRP